MDLCIEGLRVWITLPFYDAEYRNSLLLEVKFLPGCERAGFFNDRSCINPEMPVKVADRACLTEMLDTQRDCLVTNDATKP